MQVVIQIAKYALTQVEEDEYGNCMVRFLAKTLTSFTCDGDDTHPVLSDILEWLLSTISPDAHIRFRMCFFVNAILNAMGADAQLEDTICNSIQVYMLERLRDINQNVRLQAVYALMRLQNPEDPNDKVIGAYIFHIESDPSPKVRQATITAVAKNMRTIPILINRFWDSDEKVRRHTVLQMCKFPVRQYKIMQRLKILEQVLKDQSHIVKQACTRIMLPQWIESYNRNYVAFISSLMMDATEEELIRFRKVAIDALVEIFRKHSVNFIIDSLGLVQSEHMERCIPPNELTIEKIILWQAVIRYFGETEAADIDEILPDLSTMAVLLRQFIDINQHKNEPTAERYERLTYQFSLYCLLQIISDYDFGDEVGRKNMKDQILHILQNIYMEESTIKVALKIIEDLIPLTDDRLYKVSEMLRSMTDHQSFDLKMAKAVTDAYLETNPDVELEIEIRQQSMKILDLTEQLTTAMNKSNYTSVQQIRDELDASVEVYKILIKPILEASKDDAAAPLIDSLYRKRRVNTETLIKSLQILFYLTASKNVKQINPSVAELYRKLVCVYFEAQELNIRSWALKCGTSCAMLYESIAKEVFHVLNNQFQNTTSVLIWRTSILCIFEMIERYGFAFFGLEKEENGARRGRTLFNNDASQDDIEDQSANTTTLFKFMVHLMDNCEENSIKVNICLCFILLLFII